MPVLVRILGIIIIAVVIIIEVRPDVLKRFVEYVIRESKMIYFAGVVRIIIGVFLLLAASQCKISPIILVLGIIILASGILVFLLGLERVKKMLGWVVEKSPTVHRLIALIALVFGVLLVYAA